MACAAPNVVSVRIDAVGLQQNSQEIHSGVATLLLAITGHKDEVSAWRSLVSPKERVGIKVAGGRAGELGTHPGVVAAILEGLQKAGVKRSNIIVWSSANPVFDSQAFVTAPLLGELIWGDLLFKKQGQEKLSELSHLRSELLKVQKIINVPVLCGSEELGVLGALFNMTIPNIDNWRRFVQPPAFGDPYLCELYADPRIGPKVVLHLMDGLVAQYAGGPQSQPNYAFEHRTLYASKDPVALDRMALERITRWRTQAKLPPLRPVAYLESAQAMGLGPGEQEGPQ